MIVSPEKLLLESLSVYSIGILFWAQSSHLSRFVFMRTQADFARQDHTKNNESLLYLQP
jgi:hypothetical protein